MVLLRTPSTAGNLGCQRFDRRKTSEEHVLQRLYKPKPWSDRQLSTKGLPMNTVGKRLEVKEFPEVGTASSPEVLLLDLVGLAYSEPFDMT